MKQSTHGQQPSQHPSLVQGDQHIPQPSLHATLKGSQGSFELGSTLVEVGRAPTNHLRMSDSEVSLSHMRIYPQGQHHIIVDLASTNGTFLNGHRLFPNTPYPLTNEDTVRIGNTTFSYRVEASLDPAKGSYPAPLLPSNTNQKTSTTHSSTSPLQASFLLYVAILGIIVCVGGIALSRYNILPTDVTSIATALGALLAFITSIWTLLVKIFPHDIWQSARKLPVLALCLLTVGIVSIPAIHLYSLTDPYIHQGQLGLNDPLTNQSQYQWQNEKDCLFKEGAYHVSHTGKSSNTICQTTGYKNLRNFVYEVEVKIIQGDHAGIVFRIDASKYNYYKFIIAPSGKYSLEARENYGLKDTLAIGMAPSNGVDYKIAVVAQGNTITVYVNQQIVVVKKIISNDLDSAIISGQIGVIAGCDDYPLTAEAVFSNAEVWEL